MGKEKEEDHRGYERLRRIHKILSATPNRSSKYDIKMRMSS